MAQAGKSYTWIYRVNTFVFVQFVFLVLLSTQSLMFSYAGFFLKRTES